MTGNNAKTLATATMLVLATVSLSSQLLVVASALAIRFEPLRPDEEQLNRAAYACVALYTALNLLGAFLVLRWMHLQAGTYVALLRYLAVVIVSFLLSGLLAVELLTRWVDTFRVFWNQLGSMIVRLSG